MTENQLPSLQKVLKPVHALHKNGSTRDHSGSKCAALSPWLNLIYFKALVNGTTTLFSFWRKRVVL